jgi:hypothetical protein
MKLCCAAVLWVSTAVIGIDSAGAQALRPARTIELRGDLAEPQDLSGVTRWRDLLVICPDESDEINLLTGADGRYEVLTTVGLLDESDKEIDMEGAASDAEHVYVVGSHSIRRTKLEEVATYKKNRKRLTRVRPHAESYSLYRLKLGDDGNLVGKDRVDLRNILQSDEILGPFFDVPGKENGIDIEGVAVQGGKLFVGFRSPVLRGNYVPVVSFLFDRPGDYELKFVQLSGRGIRDLAAVQRGFLVLAGPVGDGDGSYRLYLWNGEDCVPGDADRPGDIIAIGDLEIAPGDKPEGMAVLSESGTQWRLLLVSDGSSTASEWIVPKLGVN